MEDLDQLKNKILKLTAEYAARRHHQTLPATDPRSLLPKKQAPIPYAGRVFSEEEVVAAVNSSLDFWLTLGEEGDLFQDELSKFLGVRNSWLVNSGSSANLLAMAALTSPLIDADRRLSKGDEVITVACGFPTTVAPIIQVGAVPVFIDINTSTLNASTNQLEHAYNPAKTKAVILAHALGNPFDISSVLSFCKKYNLWLIEDNCDALGSTYSMPIDLAKSLGITTSSPGLEESSTHITRWTGTWGDISTQSFYPPHHITMGEGGSVNITSSALLSRIVLSMRDWGRDCWCPSGMDNTCGRRYSWKLGNLPEGYDHKYIYSHLGYNLKPTDIQASIGREQLKKLPSFIAARKSNWQYLRKSLDKFSRYFDFGLPTHAVGFSTSGFVWDNSDCRCSPSWFGFMLIVKPDAPFSRNDLSDYLSSHMIGNRMFFGGNLIDQPAFLSHLNQYPESIKTAIHPDASIKITNECLFLGTYPGLTQTMLDSIVTTIESFVNLEL